MLENLLEMRGISKEFSGVYALKDVNLSVREGEIHALVGENGAGKSTLMNVLSGVYPYGTYSGEIHYCGELCKFHTIKESEHKGIVIIHQELALIPYLSIAENVFLGNERGAYFNIDWDAANAESKTFLTRVGLTESPLTLIKDIGVGKQQLVEIAKALAKKVGLLILDEPTASLNENDSQQLLELLIELKRVGVTSIIISHKLNEISYVADRITVIRDGTVIQTLDKKTDSFDEPTIIHAMVGRDLSDRFPKRSPKIGEIAFEVRNWNVDHPIYDGRKVCDNVNINVRKGEVVGISGLMGAGRTELAMSVFGKSYGANITGQVFINGKEVRLNSVQEAIDHKLAYVTEDRKGNGLVLMNPISTNTTLAKMNKVSHHGVIDADKEVQVAEKYRSDMRTKSTDVYQNVGSLSGGNQQKVLLAKWMFADPDVLILDEPTRGIDVGAKYDIYVLINQLVAEGKSVIMISSEMPEVLGMCDRIYVMNEGRIVAEMPAKEASQHSIMAAILQSEKK
ncbi:MAG: sugar ABC transporter ATP-binding protein [Spirochaetaceae bacterium]|jgi:putative multiple sugar transport system ATP-binding protein|nr:sugar ABC transporter ATP-binding protein [Spirochaetaceae bacterium]GMO27831.1 MAG: sugar ABC transporter ATP-binding protein [Termitinemataceae bacterium]